MMHTKLRSLLPGNKITNLLGETDDNQLLVTYNSIISIIINHTFYFTVIQSMTLLITYILLYLYIPMRVVFYFLTLSTIIHWYNTRVGYKTHIFILLKPCTGLHIKIILQNTNAITVINCLYTGLVVYQVVINWCRYTCWTLWDLYLA